MWWHLTRTPFDGTACVVESGNRGADRLDIFRKSPDLFVETCLFLIFTTNGQYRGQR